MTNSADDYINRKVAVSGAGANAGAIIGRALTELSAAMAAGTDLRVVANATSDADALRAITFDFDVSARVNAVAQILVPMVDELAAEHARKNADCFDECAETLLYNCLMDVLQLALAESKAKRAARAQGKAAEAMLDDPDTAGSAVAAAAKRKLDELLASMSKGN